jgi:hypothetical protein
MTDISSGQFPIRQQEEMHEAFNGFCAFPGCVEKVSEFHHKLPNTKVNRSKFPLFLSSPFNMWPCCRKHHVDGNRPKIRDEEAAIYERFLEGLKNGSNY